MRYDIYRKIITAFHFISLVISKTRCEHMKPKDIDIYIVKVNNIANNVCTLLIGIHFEVNKDIETFSIWHQFTEKNRLFILHAEQIQNANETGFY